MRGKKCRRADNTPGPYDTHSRVQKKKMTTEALRARPPPPSVVPPCALHYCETLSAPMASINCEGVEADNEHMARSDPLTTAWWVMLTRCRFRDEILPGPRSQRETFSRQKVTGPLSLLGLTEFCGRVARLNIGGHPNVRNNPRRHIV